MAKIITSGGKRNVRHKKRPGVVSKCKTSKIKTSKFYRKKYRGQGGHR